MCGDRRRCCRPRSAHAQRAQRCGQAVGSSRRTRSWILSSSAAVSADSVRPALDACIERLPVSVRRLDQFAPMECRWPFWSRSRLSPACVPQLDAPEPAPAGKQFDGSSTQNSSRPCSGARFVDRARRNRRRLAFHAPAAAALELRIQLAHVYRQHVVRTAYSGTETFVRSRLPERRVVNSR